MVCPFYNGKGDIPQQQLLSYYLLILLFINKTWLSERFSLLSRYELLLLERFLFYFNVSIFL